MFVFNIYSSCFDGKRYQYIPTKQSILISVRLISQLGTVMHINDASETFWMILYDMTISNLSAVFRQDIEWFTLDDFLI